MKTFTSVILAIFAIGVYAENPATLPIKSYDALEEYAVSQVNYLEGGVTNATGQIAGAGWISKEIGTADKATQVLKTVSNYNPEVVNISGQKSVSAQLHFYCYRVQPVENGERWDLFFRSTTGSFEINDGDRGVTVKPESDFILGEYIPITIDEKVNRAEVVHQKGSRGLNANNGMLYFPRDLAGIVITLTLLEDDTVVAQYDDFGRSVEPSSVVLEPVTESFAGFYPVDLSDGPVEILVEATDVYWGEAGFYSKLEVRSDPSDEDWIGKYVHIDMFYTVDGKEGPVTYRYHPNYIELVNVETREEMIVWEYTEVPGWFYIQTPPGTTWRGKAHIEPKGR